jgi:hypothetical protein
MISFLIYFPKEDFTLNSFLILNFEKIQELLPSLVPLILSFLQSSGNPFLNKFLDIDGDGDVDIADLLKLASRFLRI